MNFVDPTGFWRVYAIDSEGNRVLVAEGDSEEELGTFFMQGPEKLKEMLQDKLGSQSLYNLQYDAEGEKLKMDINGQRVAVSGDFKFTVAFESAGDILSVNISFEKKGLLGLGSAIRWKGIVPISSLMLSWDCENDELISIVVNDSISISVS